MRTLGDGLHLCTRLPTTWDILVESDLAWTLLTHALVLTHLRKVGDSYSCMNAGCCDQVASESQKYKTAMDIRMFPLLPRCALSHIMSRLRTLEMTTSVTTGVSAATLEITSTW